MPRGGAREGAGRKPGGSNRQNAVIKSAVIEAAMRAGGKDGLVGYLQTQATSNPNAFMALLGKIIPTQVQGPDDAEGNPTAVVMRIVDPGA